MSVSHLHEDVTAATLNWLHVWCESHNAKVYWNRKIKKYTPVLTLLQWVTIKPFCVWRFETGHHYVYRFLAILNDSSRINRKFWRKVSIAVI